MRNCGILLLQNLKTGGENGGRAAAPVLSLSRLVEYREVKRFFGRVELSPLNVPNAPQPALSENPPQTTFKSSRNALEERRWPEHQRSSLDSLLQLDSCTSVRVCVCVCV